MNHKTSPALNRGFPGGGPAPERPVDSARLAYAAAHVVTRPDRSVGDHRPVQDQIDWDRTNAFRRHLWSLGLGVAEAMDTAQRGLLGWDAASELLERTLAAAREFPPEAGWPEVMGGAGTDGLRTSGEPTLTQMIDEYVRQAEFIQSRGGSVILLATPLMPRLFPDPESYLEVYTQIARQLRPPIFVHWLGEMFAADLAGYFPGDSFERIMAENAERIKGVKISLLDESREVEIRDRLLPFGQIVLTGDDFHYPDLILGDAATTAESVFEIHGRRFPVGRFSHALLGVFDAIAPVAAKALQSLSRGNIDVYRNLMAGTQRLGELLFEPPTQYYKAGVVFLAYLNGHQDHFSLIGDLHLRRSPGHYRRVLELARQCGALSDPQEAERRIQRLGF